MAEGVVALLTKEASSYNSVNSQSWDIAFMSILGGSSHVHRFCGLVHPSYFSGLIAPTRIPLKSPGL